MNISAPFILRPIGTTLLAAGLFLLGATAYFELPVASLPAVDFPTLRVQASRPGADPQIMAATIAAPIEKRLGEIAGVTELTSVSSQGTASISVQFDLSRDIDGAARDVQAALNAATADLPGDLPDVPTFRKYNPSAAPILILAMTSKNLTASAIYDAADTVVAQRISQVPGVAQVEVSGAEQPAVRVRVNPTLLASMGLSMEEVRTAIAEANAVAPVGAVDGDKQAITIDTNTQLRDAKDYGAIVLKTRNGNVVRLSSVASVEHGTRNTRSAAMFDKQPGVLLIIRKQPEANVLDTVDQVKELIPNLQRWIPAGIDIQVLTDRTTTIRASVHDMQFTLLLAIALVMMVVFVFLRRMTPTLAAGITVPLSLAGTCAAMWALGFSVNNLTLMAFAIAVGFVVDDAIVMIENVYRNIESRHGADAGLARRRAADRLHRRVDQRIAGRRIHPGVVHGRRRRALDARVLGDPGRRHRHLCRRLAVGHADDLRPLSQGAEGREARTLRSPRRRHARLADVGLCADAARRRAQPGGYAVLAAVRHRR